MPLSRTSSRSTPGKAENGASVSMSAIDSRQAQSLVSRSSLSWILRISEVQPAPFFQRMRAYPLARNTHDDCGDDPFIAAV